MTILIKYYFNSGNIKRSRFRLKIYEFNFRSGGLEVPVTISVEDYTQQRGYIRPELRSRTGAPGNGWKIIYL